MEKIGKMKKAGSLFLAMAVAVMLGALPTAGQSVDPCTQTTKLTGGTNVDLSSGNQKMGNISGTDYHYEIWVNSRPASAKLTLFGSGKGGGGAFKAEWNNNDDYLGRVGYNWGNSGAKWDTYSNLCADFNYTRSGNGTGGNYSYIGIYGWTLNPVMEWYIIDDWFGSGQLGPATICGNGCSSLGTVTVDGGTYNIYTNTRPAGSGCVGCNGQAFPQIFSIRQGMGSNNRKCGTYSISEHFKAWSKISSLSSKIGSNLYEAKFLAEAGGGTGWLELTHLSLSKTGGCGASTQTPTYTLTTAASPTAGGTVTKNPNNANYNSGATVTVTATPATGYTFDKWSGDATGNTNSLSVTMNANKTVTATFVQKPITKFTLTTTVSPATGGTITATPAASTYDSATVVKLKAKANNGYTFTGWSGGATGTADSVNVTMNANKTVTATFVQNAAPPSKFTLTTTASPAEGGTITASPAASTYDSATVVKLKAVANEGYLFIGWSGDGIGQVGPAVPAVDSITVTMNANKTLTAAFSKKTGIARDALYAKNKRGLTVTPVSNSALNVGFTAKNSGAASINLYSLKGDLLSSAMVQTTAGAYQSHTISAAKLSTGFYVVKVSGDGFTEQARAVVPR